MPKEAIFDKTLEVQIVERDIPTPGDDEVCVKVVVAASNPKDWKVPQWEFIKEPFNHGDDFAGYVHSVGKNVTDFRPGDRVSCYHKMMHPHGAYAEYAVAPASTTFTIPPNVSFEEAVTLTLPAHTAAIGLFQVLGYAAPWVRNAEKVNAGKPLIVWGGSTAVGAFVIKFAKLAGISPVVAVAGKGADYVKSIIDPKTDHVVDYRSPTVADDIKKALGGQAVHHAYDAVTEGSTYRVIAEVLEKKDSKFTYVLLLDEKFEHPAGVTSERTNVGSAHFLRPEEPDDRDFALVWSRYMGAKLAEGKLKGHPWRYIEGGLKGVAQGLKELKEGKVSTQRLLYKISEEK